MKWRLLFAKPQLPGKLIDLEVQMPASEVVDTVLRVGFDGATIPAWLREDVERVILTDPQWAISMIETRLRMPQRQRARQAAAAGFRKARRARGVNGGALRRERPAWQRRGVVPTRIWPAMTNPRVRGQLSA